MLFKVVFHIITGLFTFYIDTIEAEVNPKVIYRQRQFSAVIHLSC